MRSNWCIFHQQIKSTMKTFLYKPCNQVTDWPPDTQHGQKVSRRKWEELQEERSIHGQVTTNTKTEAGVQSGHSHPIGRAARCQSKNTGNKEGHVKGRSTSDNI